MVNGIKRQMGFTLILTGLLHTVVGLFFYAEPLQQIVANGFWNAVGREEDAAFWFMMFGFLLILLGYMADWVMKKKGMEPPATFGWTILGICVVGVIAMPVSGFWLALPQAGILLRK
ncbi:DUF6463 family protein [Brevibacillus porteri]|uniref:DUF4064 domain-containing protein n=1 Tax=Brevibacillus porteri TaxID=2126350 RepID=A0ABX5FRY0_9BACL|nr:DUF6463 family protein [Brevibacillus porteri]MED1797971.1 DUF6463 family protein [Brevibacillus porteri]MED2132194.1 DUF6463 family protein [Brevibacillus porteri]MED2748107.1 DUF6463 family protein [Brevibacillus porteri]MED2814233.1 DUF6463 family protein [Brevibacillus porteri]MED2893794.1 DUF6463 family protein [Brevibacillus porteri]